MGMRLTGRDGSRTIARRLYHEAFRCDWRTGRVSWLAWPTGWTAHAYSYGLAPDFNRIPPGSRAEERSGFPVHSISRLLREALRATAV